ncbi:hypothetical protein D9619_007467 [Psilocybe cf. subviscida]|uniref:ABM domain-containing protein n=1 Tax=Psilocybe cf. subviscida TaxID=2480587 RepID=A0A8H5EWY0_9AGAR|nr:hypothetical protein D9619_007467 [Psilocybe cf. subviscida]
MPYFLEVISFDTLHHDDAVSGAFAQTQTPSALFNVIGRLDGCVSVVGGYELEDKRRAYVITAWTSYEAYHYTCNTRPVLSILNPAFQLSPISISNTRIYHLTVDMHPCRTLSAPVTEIVVVSQRADLLFAQRAWEKRVDGCVVQLKAGLYAVDGAYPPLLWGEIKQMPGSYLMLVGWEGVEAHTKAVRQPSLRKHVLEILRTAHTRAVHTKLRSLVSINTTKNATPLDTSIGPRGSANSGREVSFERKLQTSM